MASLIFTVFVLQLALYLIDKLGASTFNDLLWQLYNRFPTSTSSSARDELQRRREIVRLKRELNSVSAQDDFARWAKLRRQHDKAVADYDKLTAASSATKSTFDSRVNIVRQLAINGTKFFLQWWYVKSALFWIPQGWVPGYVEWLLAFPRAPRGSVSIQVWSIACGSVIAMVGEAVMAAAVLFLRQSSGRQPEKTAAPAEGVESK